MANSNTKVKNRYTHEKVKGLSFSKDNRRSVSRTQQHFKDDANVNVIMRKFAKSGLLTDPTRVPTRYPQFGDFSNVRDYQTLQNTLIEMNQYFMSLPAEIRTKFENDPQKLQEFMLNPENKKEAIELGLLPKDYSKLKYVRKEADGTETDITDEVIATRGIIENGTIIQGGPENIDINTGKPKVDKQADESQPTS